MNITSDALSKVMPRAPRAWLDALISSLPKSTIDTPNEIASFVAQVAHESSEFTRLQEDLSYSAKRIMEVWPKRFPTLRDAEPYARRPEMLANRVYSDRMGNGDNQSGDGWNFKGRGPIMITGRDNYTRCGKHCGVDLLSQPELLLMPEVGIQSALWFWLVKRLDELDDDKDVRLETGRINGGAVGLKERQAYFDYCLALI